jgi:ribosome modulation factor
MNVKEAISGVGAIIALIFRSPGQLAIKNGQEERCRRKSPMVALNAQAEGESAAEMGRSTTWCPYDEGDPRRDQWLKGWKTGLTKRKAAGQNDDVTKAPSPR